MAHRCRRPARSARRPLAFQQARTVAAPCAPFAVHSPVDTTGTLAAPHPSASRSRDAVRAVCPLCCLQTAPPSLHSADTSPWPTKRACCVESGTSKHFPFLGSDRAKLLAVPQVSRPHKEADDYRVVAEGVGRPAARGVQGAAGGPVPPPGACALAGVLAVSLHRCHLEVCLLYGKEVGRSGGAALSSAC
jgi:hypothetical protein